MLYVTKSMFVFAFADRLFLLEMEQDYPGAY